MDKEALEKNLREIRKHTLYRYRDAIFKKQDRIESQIKELKLDLYIIHCQIHPVGEASMTEEEIDKHLVEIKFTVLESQAGYIRHKIEMLKKAYRYLIPAGSKIVLGDERNALLDDKTFDWW